MKDEICGYSDEVMLKRERRKGIKEGKGRDLKVMLRENMREGEREIRFERVFR